MIHRKKILPEYYNDILLNNKRFEIRENDAGYVIGDTVCLMEYKDNLTGREIEVEITYISDYAQKEGYVVFGFAMDECSLKNIKKFGRIIIDQHEDGQYQMTVQDFAVENRGAFISECSAQEIVDILFKE